MTAKNKGSKNGNYQELIEILEHHNIITYKEKAIEHTDKLVPVAHQFIKDITETINPDDYPGQPNEFIEMVIAFQTYVAASLLIALTDMFPDVPLSAFLKNHKKSLDASLAVQLRNLTR
jgi:hypothetical protein